jgi:leucyl-tRNA synthetase
LYDCGIVKTKEPFQKLFNQGMILGEDGTKMSKSRGNVVNPDDIVKEYGADTLRVYEMFMGPLEVTKPWSTKAVEGSRRFLDRIYRFYTEVAVIDDNDLHLEKVYHQTVKKVTEDYENLRFNTAIAQMMIFMNECYKHPSVPRAFLEGFLQLLNPVAPHITEELWSTVLGRTDTITFSTWPTYDLAKTLEEQATIVVQVNGKIRDKMEIDYDVPKEQVIEKALALPKIIALIEGKEIKKTIVVPNKIVNIVV